jgi:hypothetical protein
VVHAPSQRVQARHCKIHHSSRLSRKGGTADTLSSLHHRNNANHCCADCGMNGGASLKACKSCMLVKYCNATCQRNHWLKHKKLCKQRAAELHDEALFRDSPAKEDCPICFLPMPISLVSCVSLPPATILSVPVNDYANEHEELAKMCTYEYYSCCGKSICGGCVNSFCRSGNIENVHFAKHSFWTKPKEKELKN